MYIIDGNNLAGKLDLLRDKSCNQKLEKILSEYFVNTKKKVIIVYDSVDPLGDKYMKGKLQVVYSPRDGYYSSADDKIIELINNNKKQDVIVISDDIEIRGKIESLNNKGYGNLSSYKASDFASDIKEHKTRQENEEIDNNKGLSNDKINEINEELKQYWDIS
jgi:predicted RNA-binding protein with PIN domain